MKRTADFIQFAATNETFAIQTPAAKSLIPTRVGYSFLQLSHSENRLSRENQNRAARTCITESLRHPGKTDCSDKSAKSHDRNQTEIHIYGRTECNSCCRRDETDIAAPQWDSASIDRYEPEKLRHSSETSRSSPTSMAGPAPDFRQHSLPSLQACQVTRTQELQDPQAAERQQVDLNLARSCRVTNVFRQLYSSSTLSLPVLCHCFATVLSR
jgi:hypothetical protein